MGHHHDHDDDHDHYYDDSYLHDNQFVFLRHYLEMLETCEQGLDYITKRIKEEMTLEIPVLGDCTEALNAIDDANFLAANLMKKIDHPTYELIYTFKDLNPVFDQIKNATETENMEELASLLTDTLQPRFVQWSRQVHQALLKHIQH